MKEIYLAYNKFTKHYILASSPDYERDRRELKAEGDLVKKLRGIINIKRKSILYLEDLSEGVVLKISNFLKETKVKVKELK